MASFLKRLRTSTLSNLRSLFWMLFYSAIGITYKPISICMSCITHSCVVWVDIDGNSLIEYHV
uniref:Uncharacterized protein n=1 Tax=Rhizophora mucronata TaxID=61149 RepID=A0A2P2M8U5_RHIMU